MLRTAALSWTLASAASVFDLNTSAPVHTLPSRFLSVTMDGGALDYAVWQNDALAAALKAGTITNAEYASQARELGASTATVAAVLRSVIYAAGPAEHVKTLTTAASSSSSSTIALAPAPAPASVEAASAAAVPISDGDASVSAVEAALNWLTTRDQRWGMRAAERLNPDNDFLHDLDLYLVCRRSNRCPSSAHSGLPRVRLAARARRRRRWARRRRPA